MRKFLLSMLLIITLITITTSIKTDNEKVLPQTGVADATFSIDKTLNIEGEVDYISVVKEESRINIPKNSYKTNLPNHPPIIKTEYLKFENTASDNAKLVKATKALKDLSSFLDTSDSYLEKSQDIYKDIILAASNSEYTSVKIKYTSNGTWQGQNKRYVYKTGLPNYKFA